MDKEQRYALKLETARLYYIEKKTQMEITQLLGISRPTLIKLLKEAQDEGIVHIEVRDVRKLSQYAILEKQLVNVLGVKDAKVLSAPQDDSDAIATAIGRQAAPYILRYFGNGMRIGVGWGRTMEALSHSMRTGKDLRNVTLMPMMGGPGSSREGYTVFSNRVCEVLATYVKGRVEYMYTPLFVHDPLVHRAYMEMPGICAMLEKYDQLDLALVGVDGDAGHSTTFSMESALMRHAPPDELTRVAGNVCAHFYDEQGQMLFPELEKRMISISTRQLRQVPTVIGLAGGAYKVRSILGGARAGLFNVLVTDEYTARKIVERGQEEGGSCN